MNSTPSTKTVLVLFEDLTKLHNTVFLFYHGSLQHLVDLLNCYSTPDCLSGIVDIELDICFQTQVIAEKIVYFISIVWIIFFQIQYLILATAEIYPPLFCLFPQRYKMFLFISPVEQHQSPLLTYRSGSWPIFLHRSTFFQLAEPESWWSIFFTLLFYSTHVLLLILCTRGGVQEHEQVLQGRKSRPPVQSYSDHIPCSLP